MVNKCVYLYQYKTVCYFGLVYFSIFASKTYLNPPCEGGRGTFHRTGESFTYDSKESITSETSPWPPSKGGEFLRNLNILFPWS